MIWSLIFYLFPAYKTFFIFIYEVGKICIILFLQRNQLGPINTNSFLFNFTFSRAFRIRQVAVFSPPVCCSYFNGVIVFYGHIINTNSIYARAKWRALGGIGRHWMRVCVSFRYIREMRRVLGRLLAKGQGFRTQDPGSTPK